MDETSKLKHLASHWLEHNGEHAGTYEEWADRMRKAGREDVAAQLRILAAETRKLDGILGKLQSLL